MKVVAICGSLRKDSFNKKLLNDVLKRLKERKIDVFEQKIDDLPLFNADLEENPPESVKNLKKHMESADGFVFITPEYNFTLPGGFKNAIDWASRPGADITRVFGGKIALIGGVSNGARATVRAQMHMLSVGQTLKLIISPWTISIGPASEAYDARGKLVKESAIEQVETAVEKFVDLLRKTRNG